MKNYLKYGCIAGPFDAAPFVNFQINWFGIIPKSTPGKWRLITDLSFPHRSSVMTGFRLKPVTFLALEFNKLLIKL